MASTQKKSERKQLKGFITWQCVDELNCLIPKIHNAGTGREVSETKKKQEEDANTKRRWAGECLQQNDDDV